MKGDAQDARIMGSCDGFDTLIAGGPLSLRNQACHHQDLRVYVQPLRMDTTTHLAFQRPHLVKDIHHLAAGVRPAQHPCLSEPAVWRQDGDGEDHRDAREKLLQVAR